MPVEVYEIVLADLVVTDFTRDWHFIGTGHTVAMVGYTHLVLCSSTLTLTWDDNNKMTWRLHLHI